MISRELLKKSRAKRKGMNLAESCRYSSLEAAARRLQYESSGERYSFELLPKPIHPIELLRALKS